MKLTLGYIALDGDQTSIFFQPLGSCGFLGFLCGKLGGGMSQRGITLAVLVRAIYKEVPSFGMKSGGFPQNQGVRLER
jgi:hypothetical protein